MVENCAFCKIISEFLHNRRIKHILISNWNVLSEIASIHQVKGIIYKQCKDFIPEEYKADYLKSYSADLYNYSNRVKMMDEISNSFEKQNILFYTVKGLDIASLYPVPALRTMGDCDIVVQSEDKERAHQIMLSLGFQNTQKEGMEWVYYKNGLEFEIHDHLLYDEEVNADLHKNFMELAWDYTIGDGCEKKLDWNFHFIFLLLHVKKHLMNHGIGFRQFMDLAVVIQKIDLDWNWIIERLDELQLHQFFDVCCSLIHRWFDIQIPVSYKDIDGEFYASATQYVFDNGVFGFDNEKNSENRQLNHITEKSGPRWISRIRYVLDSIFPSYEGMRYVPCYGFVNNRPWLLPAAWIYRWYRAIRYRMTDNGKRIIDNAMIPNERLDARREELRSWGL